MCEHPMRKTEHLNMSLHYDSCMTKYKCPKSGCKYVSDEPGQCCHVDLVEVSGEGESKSSKGGCSCC